MTYLVFQFERVPTASGEMLVATDEEGRLRALDWEDCEARMHKLLRLHYGANNVRLDRRRPASAARRSVEAYLAGDLPAIDKVPVKTGGTAFQREVWAALRTMLRRVGRATRSTQRGARRGPSDRRQPGRRGRAVPPRDRRQRVANRIWRWLATQTLASRA